VKRILLLVSLLALTIPASAQTVYYPGTAAGGTATVSTSFGAPLFVNGATSATGTIGALNAAVTLNVTGMGSVRFQLQSMPAANANTVTFECTVDGTNYKVPTDWTTSTATADGIWAQSVGGCSTVRARTSTYASGTPTATIVATLSGGAAGGAGGGSVPTGSAGTPNASVVSMQGITGMRPVDVNVTGGSAVDVNNNALVTPVGSPTTTYSAAPCFLSSAATTNATNCKASAGNVYGFRAVNTTSTLYYLRMYNTAAAPTCSSATGFVETIPIPASTTGAGVVSMPSVPVGYATGISFCLTAGSSSTDNTAAATGVFLTVIYK
jgi:hypothetical protein